MTGWRRRPGLGAAVLAALAAASCTGGGGPTVELARLPAITVGQSSRSDVLRVMGRPSQVLRSAKGESWVYQVEGESRGGRGLAAGAQAATAVAGALIPFAGLIGTGIGLADSMRRDPQRPDGTTLTIDFAEPGIVRDCTYATNAITAEDLAGAGGRTPLDCRRLASVAAPPAE